MFDNVRRHLFIRSSDGLLFVVVHRVTHNPSNMLGILISQVMSSILRSLSLYNSFTLQPRRFRDGKVQLSLVKQEMFYFVGNECCTLSDTIVSQRPWVAKVTLNNRITVAEVMLLTIKISAQREDA